MRVIPKEWRREGVVECLKNEQIAAIVEEAEYAEAVKHGYYDEDGNWVYYEAEEAVEKVPTPPPTAPQVAPPQPQTTATSSKQPTPKPQNGAAPQIAAKDEAAQAAKEAAQAAKEASQSIMKGFGALGFGGGSKKQSSGGLLGGLMKAATVEPAVAKKAQPVKPQKKPQNPHFPKPYTNDMNPKQRWLWAYRRIVQVNN